MCWFYDYEIIVSDIDGADVKRLSKLISPYNSGQLARIMVAQTIDQDRVYLQ